MKIKAKDIREGDHIEDEQGAITVTEVFSMPTGTGYPNIDGKLKITVQRNGGGPLHIGFYEEDQEIEVLRHNAT